MQNDRPVRIILVRHGITTWNKDSRYQGQTDVPLSPEGIRQAELAGKRLSGMAVDRIFSSDLSRARQTAEIIASNLGGMPVKTDCRLREMSFGGWEGLTFDEIGTRWPEKQKAWLKDPVNLCPPDGETARDLAVRLKLALTDIWDELRSLWVTTGDGTGDRDGDGTGDRSGGRAPCGVVVAHGGVIRALISYANTGDMTNMWSVGVKQASLTSCDMCGDSLVLLEVNDVSHLDTSESPDKLSQSVTGAIPGPMVK